MSSEKSSVTDQLGEPFPKELLRQHPVKNLTYVPISEVVARLNRVLGVGSWGYTVVRTWEAGTKDTPTGNYPVWVMAHVRLMIDSDKLAVATQVDGVGGQKVKMLNSGEGPVDLGDEYKGAVSDALKKAAQHLGIGLELARKEEALAWEERVSAPPPTPPDGFETVEAAQLAHTALRGLVSLLAPPDRKVFDTWVAAQEFGHAPWAKATIEAMEAEVVRIREVAATESEPFA